MSNIVNFAIPTKLNNLIKKAVKQKGFANRAEFFRFSALQTLGTLVRPHPLDTIITEARVDYAKGNYKTFSNAKGALKELKKIS